MNRQPVYNAKDPNYHIVSVPNGSLAVSAEERTRECDAGFLDAAGAAHGPGHGARADGGEGVMKYAIEATINYGTTERQVRRVEGDASLAGIALTELLEKYSRATSFVVTVVSKSS